MMGLCVKSMVVGREDVESDFELWCKASGETYVAEWGRKRETQGPGGNDVTEGRTKPLFPPRLGDV